METSGSMLGQTVCAEVLTERLTISEILSAAPAAAFDAAADRCHAVRLSGFLCVGRSMRSRYASQTKND
jgi:hypothetical protein